MDWYATTDVPRERWLFDPANAFDNVGPEPEFDQAILDDADDRVVVLAEDAAEEQDDEAADRADDLSDAVAAYKERNLPVNRRGWPRVRPFDHLLREFTAFRFTRRQVKDAWEAQGG